MKPYPSVLWHFMAVLDSTCCYRIVQTGFGISALLQSFTSLHPLFSQNCEILKCCYFLGLPNWSC
uniref:Uncharacterized protein n=1 Tax=Arundo donax TaxID=35708 RepID=A0A0A9FWR4_ARUDO